MDDKIRDLLWHILHEPGFRGLVETDTVAALAKVGLVVQPSIVPTPVCLPSDEEIEELLEEEEECMIVQKVLGWQKQDQSGS